MIDEPVEAPKTYDKFTGRIAHTNLHLDGNRSQHRPKSMQVYANRGNVKTTKVENHWEFQMVAAHAAAPETYDKVHGANSFGQFSRRAQ